MGRRRKGRNVHGVLLLDKPEGFSSNQAVQKLRWLYGARKAGHTGSLDPFATGLLPICFGEASKTAGFMLDAVKTYRATALLGSATSTGDPEGEVVDEQPVPELTRDLLEAALDRFRGEIEQVPPMYSALKHQGQRLYELAREGRQVAREARTVTIHELELLEWEAPRLSFRVVCSKGTYVRTLAQDIATELGTCAHLEMLRREGVGVFRDQGMVTLEQVERAVKTGEQDALLLPVDAGLADWPVLELDEEAAVRFVHGNPAPAQVTGGGDVRVYGPEDRLLGLAEARIDGTVYPKRVFVW